MAGTKAKAHIHAQTHKKHTYKHTKTHTNTQATSVNPIEGFGQVKIRKKLKNKNKLKNRNGKKGQSIKRKKMKQTIDRTGDTHTHTEGQLDRQIHGQTYQQTDR